MMAADRSRPIKTRVRSGLRRLWRSLPHRPRPCILMYHRIAEDRFDPWGLAVAPAYFAEQIAWLARHRTVLPLDRFAQLHAARRLPRNAVALTFDDGYACAIREGLPVLQKHDVSATVFLPAELIERQREFWWDELARIITSYRAHGLRFNGKTVTVPSATPGDEDWPPGAPPRTARQQLFHDLWSELRVRSPADLDDELEQLRGHYGSESARESHRPASIEEVRGANSGVMQFGSHALTHPSLPTLEPAEKSRQIGASVERCAALTGTRPRAFAYPYGDWDEGSRRLVEDAGFACACSTEERFVSRSSDMFLLPRKQVGNWSARRLAAVLAGR